jgi:lipopolysaccharide biosynthesis regulator YciM
MNMLNDWMIEICAVLVVVAAAAGWFVASRSVRREWEDRMRRVVQDLKQQHAVATEKLRSAHTAARLEVEQLRSTSPRQIAAATSEQRAATARLAESLKQAYAELDRLRAQVNPAGSKARSGPVDAFALTQPFEQGM